MRQGSSRAVACTLAATGGETPRRCVVRAVVWPTHTRCRILIHTSTSLKKYEEKRRKHALAQATMTQRDTIGPRTLTYEQRRRVKMMLDELDEVLALNPVRRPADCAIVSCRPGGASPMPHPCVLPHSRSLQ